MTSLRARLFLTIGLVVLLCVGVTVGVGVVLTRRSVERAALAALERQADVLAVRERSVPFTPVQAALLRTFFRRQNERLAVLDTAALQEVSGRRIPPAIVAAVNAGRAANGRTSFEGVPILYAVRPAGSQVLVLSRPARLGPADWGSFIWALVIAGLIGVGLSAGASYLLARSIARPVVRVAQASRRLAAGDRPGPVPVEDRDELGVLASSFNQMADQLQRARESEQSFLLSVSHELKTPLTAIRGYAEGLEEGAVDPREAGEVIGREGARLERLVADLLDLGRLNRKAFTVRRENVDLAVVAGEAVRRYDARARSFGVALAVEAPTSAPASGDPDRVLQVVSNLVENALRVTPSGGSVVVVARPGTVSVRDSGPGIPPEDVPRAFERFFLYERFRGERPVGSGLGLAIVKELTEAMGGTVAVQSAPGAGTTFTVALPGPAPSPAVPPPPPSVPPSANARAT